MTLDISTATRWWAATLSRSGQQGQYLKKRRKLWVPMWQKNVS
jgi:hypothetical protein